jgi:nitrite reductase (NO-forming)
LRTGAIEHLTVGSPVWVTNLRRGNATNASPVAAPGERRCKPRARRSGSLRPTDVIGAFFLLGIAMLVAGAVVGALNAIDPWRWGGWLALHLVFVGGISQLVLGASQFFAGAFLATDPPGRARVRAQIAFWNLGTVLLALAVPLGSDPLVWIAGAALLVALLAYRSGLLQMQRRSLQTAPWAARWYLAAAAALALGIGAGLLLATGMAWSAGDLLAAHMSLNVAGWFGMAIVGTLHTFYPSLTKTTLPFPRLQAPTFAAWGLGVAALAVGYGWLVDPLAVAGWIALAAAAVGLLVNVLTALGRAPRPLSLPARLLAVAQVFLVGALLLACVSALGSGPAEALSGSLRAAVGTFLVVGWVGITVLGSLLHLLAVVVRVRDLSRPMPAPRPRPELLLSATAAIAVLSLGTAQLADLDGLRMLASALLFVVYLLLAARVGALALRVLAVARPRV